MVDLYNKKTCAYCGVNGAVRKAMVVFKYSNSARLCYFCIEKLGGVENARDWLEQHALFDGRGGFWFVKDRRNELLLKPFLVNPVYG